MLYVVSNHRYSHSWLSGEAKFCCTYLLNRLSVSFKEGDEFKANLFYKVGVKEMTLTGKKEDRDKILIIPVILAAGIRMDGKGSKKSSVASLMVATDNWINHMQIMFFGPWY